MQKPKLRELMINGKGLSGFEWPENCGDFDMRIARDGTWYYRNSPIGRIELVKLFATVLQRDADGKYWLVTPVERGEIIVEDSPFVALEMQVVIRKNKQILRLRTNLDHWVEAGGDHPVWVVEKDNGEPIPYIHIRDGLNARIHHNVFYQMVDVGYSKADAQGIETLYIDSGANSYRLGALQ
ncbi:MAG: DUF1285 domain-containing protein [Pseudomonadota bacterium]